MTCISLVSINIERAKHYARIIPFLAGIRPDVVCLQELRECDVGIFRNALAMNAVFVPFGVHPQLDGDVEDPGVVGIGMFARNIRGAWWDYYAGNEAGAREFLHQVFRNLALLECDVEKDGVVYRVLTTHFTWSANGEATDAQRVDLQRMLDMLATRQPFVLAGDFNAPRGREIFSRLAEVHTDNIPSCYSSSIDGALHRDGPVPVMVDGLFTTAGYQASDVRLESGVSDHCAIVATIARRQGTGNAMHYAPASMRS